MKSLISSLRLISFAAISIGTAPVMAEDILPVELAGPKSSRNADHVMAYTLPLRNQTATEFDRFMKGVALFEKDWGPEDGLGPLFNQASCQACHPRDGRTGLHEEEMRLAKAVEFGGQVQDKAIDGHKPEGYVSIRLGYRVATTVHIDGIKNRDAIAIQPPQLVGLGLLEKIPAARLQALATNQAPGISGRISYVTDPETGEQVIGRFGWTAGQPNLKAQIAKASAEDMGLNNALYHQNGEKPQGNADITDDELDVLADYVRALAVPSRRIGEGSEAGFALFKSIGCTDCHVPSHTLADGTVIWPFTDMLLHDTGMGPWGRPDFDPDAPNPTGPAIRGEWRTPPLWGIGLLETVARDQVGYMHDGSARTLSDAITWHGKEARSSVKKWHALDYKDQEKLLAFLRSL